MSKTDPKRGKDNRWVPSKVDRARIVQQRAQGMPLELIAREHNVTRQTLAKTCADEIAEGKALNKGFYISRMQKLALQETNLPTSFNACRFALSVFHGMSELTPERADADDEADQVALDLSALDAKLLPYLAHEAAPKKIASTPTPAKPATRHQQRAKQADRAVGGA